MMLKLALLILICLACNVEGKFVRRRSVSTTSSTDTNQLHRTTEQNQTTTEPREPQAPREHREHRGQGRDRERHTTASPSPSKGFEVPAWFFPECPGGRVSRLRNGTLHCCQRTTNDTCRNIRKHFTLFDEDSLNECSDGKIIGCNAMSMCCRGTGPNMSCTPIRKQANVPQQASPPVQCPGGQFMACGSMRFCCTGSGASQTCKPIS